MGERARRADGKHLEHVNMSEELEAEVRKLAEEIKEHNARLERIEKGIAILIQEGPSGKATLNRMLQHEQLLEDPPTLEDVL